MCIRDRHRSEEIGARRLAYPIKDFYRGEYFLINLECNSSELASITDLFKFNENILRTSVLKKKQAETGKSALMEQTKDSLYEKDSKDEGLVKKVSNEAKEVLSKAEEVVEDAIEEVKEAAEKVEEVVEEVVEEAKEKAKGVFAKVKNVFKSDKKK